jgi:hypothetical protein
MYFVYSEDYYMRPVHAFGYMGSVHAVGYVLLLQSVFLHTYCRRNRFSLLFFLLCSHTHAHLPLSNEEPRSENNILFRKHTRSLPLNLPQHTLLIPLIQTLRVRDNAVLVQRRVADCLQPVGAAGFLDKVTVLRFPLLGGGGHGCRVGLGV